MELPDAIRRAALFPESDLPDPPPGHPARRVEVEGVPVLLPSVLPLGLVHPECVEAGRIKHAVGAVREFLREEGREKGIWFVPEAARPAGLAGRLLALGMKPNDVPGAEPREATMVCLDAPTSGPPGLVARRAETLEEYLAGQLVMTDSFGMDEAARRAVEERAEQLWAFRDDPGNTAMFVAFEDGDVVAFAAARFGRTAVYMGGGGTHPDHRGRGAYTALVQARWDAAVARGTPVLTVGAGGMSRPILERLGFSIVGWSDSLVDELA